MPLHYPAKSGGVDFDPVPAGSHIAVCDCVCDLGLQSGSTLYPQAKQQVYVRWELPNERIEFTKDGKKQVGPMVIGKTYTASMNEKATLRHHLESWRGRQFTDEEAAQFDVAAVLGKPCMLTVMHTQKGDKTYANITGIGPLPKGIDRKTIIPEIAAVVYSPDNTATYQQLPEWLRKKIDAQILPEKPAEPQAPPPEDYDNCNWYASTDSTTIFQATSDDSLEITYADLPDNMQDDEVDGQTIPF
jgi:hypothetical protein